MKNQRLISLQGANNFRDLGGYQNKEGKVVRWQKIYRADSLAELTNEDLEKLDSLNIVKDFDLRSNYEQSLAPDRKWKKVSQIDAHIYEEGNEDISPEINQKSKLLTSLPRIDTYLGSVYQKALLNPVAKMAFRKIFVGLLDLKPDQALVFHCTMGKDRTGMVAALILTGLEIDLETITKDYLLTNQVAQFNLQEQDFPKSDLNKMIEKMNISRADTESLMGITKTLEKSFGGFENYFINELGFTSADLKEFRESYLI